MINEIKKIWEKDKIGITIIILLELLISIFGKFYNERMVAGNLKVMLNIGFLLFIQFTLLAVLVFFFASQKQNLIQYEESLPERRIGLFFSRLIPALIIGFLGSILIMLPYDQKINLDIIWTVFYMSFFFFSIVYLWFFYRNLFWILLLVAFALSILFPIIIREPMSDNLTVEISWSFETHLFFAFLVPLVFYFFNYSHNLSHTKKVIIVTILVYTILNFAFLGYKIYSHCGQPIDVLGYENYITVQKSKDKKIKSIRYDLKNKKTKQKPQHNVKTYLWGSNRIIYTIDKDIVINSRTYYSTQKNISGIDSLFHQRDGILNNIYYYTGKSISRLDLDTFKKEIIMKDVSLNSPPLSILSVKDTDCVYIVTPLGIKKSIIKEANLLWDNLGIYYLKEDKILDENENIIYEFKNENKNFVSPRKFRDGNVWKTIYNGNTYDIPMDCKFNGDKFYYRESNRIIFCYIDGREIARIKIKANKKNGIDNFFIYQYKADYYLFSYDKNPIKVYKLVNGKWEFYDRFS